MIRKLLRRLLFAQYGPTIQVAVPLAEQIRDWSAPVRVRYVDDPVPMLELRSIEISTCPNCHGTGR